MEKLGDIYGKLDGTAATAAHCRGRGARRLTGALALSTAGLRDSILDFSGGDGGVAGTTPKDVIDLLLLTQ